MTAKQIIGAALAHSRIRYTDLARRLGWSPQLLSKRLKTGKFTVAEWEKIGEALGATARVGFIFPDGREI